MSNKKPASRIIALEEAFLHPVMWEHYPQEMQQRYGVVKSLLTDVGPERIKRMDAAGIDMQVLSHVQPGVQIIKDVGLAIRLCQEVNDWLGEVVQKYPMRFAGFAMLPTQSPADAAAELERTVKQYGFKGALINGHTNGVYLDDPSYNVLFDMCEKLDVPIYIHPTDPPEGITDIYYKGHPAMIPGWGWLVETGTHLLKIITSGVFDRHPNLHIIVGHMGELLPYTMSRLNQALTMGDWLIAAQEVAGTGEKPRKPDMQKSFAHYIHNNVFITTSGVFDQPVFNCAYEVIGRNNLLFSVDDPLRDNIEAMEFLRDIRLPQTEKEQLAHGNAERLLKIPAADGSMSYLPKARPLLSLRAKLKSKLGRTLISAMIK